MRQWKQLALCPKTYKSTSAHLPRNIDRKKRNSVYPMKSKRHHLVVCVLSMGSAWIQSGAIDSTPQREREREKERERER